MEILLKKCLQNRLDFTGRITILSQKHVKIKICPLEAFITTWLLSIIWIFPSEVHLKKKEIKTT